MSKMTDTFERARNVSTPLIVVNSADQPSAMAEIMRATGEEYPALSWDAACGILGANDAGRKVCEQLRIKGDDTVGFVEAMVKARDLPQGTILFALNAHRQLESAEPMATAAAIQAVSNLRNLFKVNWRTLVMLVPGMVPPAELAQDVVVLHQELPDRTRLADIVKRMYKAAKQTPVDDVVERAVEATSGLSEFAAEQVIALSFSEAGLDVDMLWERKRVAIEQTPGLRVWRGSETFADVVGCENIKARLRQRIGGRKPIGVVVQLDEIDKALANVEHDTSGVRMDQFRTLLTEMENCEWEGVLLAGTPGGGKTLLSKALGREAGVPTIMLDLAAMENALVGSSEARLRMAVAVIKAVGGGNAFFVATSNNATVMRPELQRRFTGGFFWFDPMSQAEREAAWQYYIKRYDILEQPRPADEGWTAAEIRNCVREAWNCNVSLVAAAQYIIPVTQAMAVEFDAMRKEANGRFLDASKPGHYVYKREPMEQPLRALDLKSVAQAVALAPMKES